MDDPADEICRKIRMSDATLSKNKIKAATDLRRFTIDEIIDRTRQALLSRAEGLSWVRDWILSGKSQFLRADGHEFNLFARLPSLFPVALTLQAFDDHATREARHDKSLISSAEMALRGVFNLLGIDQLAFGNPIDWHLEPTSGRRSPRVPWKQLDSLDPALTGDKKVVWELNRHLHLSILGRAFLATKDDRYAKAVGEHIASWIRENPLGLGINWVSSLELAFRCINWLWAIALLRTWDRWASLPLIDIARSLQQQGCYIEAYLSTYSSPNTHLTGEALALFYLGTCLPELRQAERWRSLGRSILIREIEKQVRPDGVYFEQSTWYHRYTAEFYMHFLLLAERAGEPLPEWVAGRVTALLDYLMWITRPDGTSPCVGDDDGGKLLKLDTRLPTDWRAALSNGVVMFGRGDYKHVAGEFAEESFWLFGSGAMEKFERTLPVPPVSNSRAFVDGGFYVMRSGWRRDSNYLLIDCGPHGAMNCGHAHADALAIEVVALGETFLMDSGTYTYTGSEELRDLFRSTAMHNTLTIDNLSSSVPAAPFKWRHVAQCTKHFWHDHLCFTYFAGSHDGYRRLADPTIHTRSVLFANREYWVVLDRVDATAEHEYGVHFHLSPGVSASVQKETGRLTANSTSASLEITFVDEQGEWSVVDGLISPCYGEKMPALHGKYIVRTKGPLSLLFILFPKTLEEFSPQVLKVNLAEGKGAVLSTQHYQDLLLWSARGFSELGVRASDFEWVWVRRSLGESILDRAVCIHGSHVSIDELEVIAEHRVDFLVIALQGRTMSIDVSPRVSLKVRPHAGIEHILINGRASPMGAHDEMEFRASDFPLLSEPGCKVEEGIHVRH